jgi:hypothetical protein
MRRKQIVCPALPRLPAALMNSKIGVHAHER